MTDVSKVTPTHTHRAAVIDVGNRAPARSSTIASRPNGSMRSSTALSVSLASRAGHDHR
jgi:hypothetical protein